MNIILPDGSYITVNQAKTLINNFYTQHANGLYDELYVPQDNHLDLACLASISFIETHNPQHESWRNLWKNKANIESKIGMVPSSLSIIDEDIPWDAIDELLKEFLSIKEFGCSRVTKILHKKRPALIPILDKERIIKKYYQSEVDKIIQGMHQYSISIGKSIPLSTLTQNALNESLVVTHLIKTVRHDVIKNVDPLKSIQNWLKKQGRSLTILRIFDIILWEKAG